MTGATVTQPVDLPATVRRAARDARAKSMSVDLGATNPTVGDQVKFTFNLPDGTTEDIDADGLDDDADAGREFAIGATPTATAANLNAALNTAIGKISPIGRWSRHRR